ncbi:hypothetical protein [Pseudomonas sp. NMS19W]|uniref:hypothetical protein n=1 Tax=Pseudomonas sp. NMS19W TaxID=3079768 RepID=UPI003F657F04
MIKPTPNPPETDPTSPYETLDSKKFHEAADRALDHYLNPFHPRKPLLKPNTRYLIAPGIPNEELLADACETLTSAKTINKGHQQRGRINKGDGFIKLSPSFLRDYSNHSCRSLKVR